MFNRSSSYTPRGVGKGNNKSQTKRDQLLTLTVLKRKIRETDKKGAVPSSLLRRRKHKNAGSGSRW